MLFRDPLKFVFSGYSIWLEPEEYQNDLTLAIDEATEGLGLKLGIPLPHVTLMYGVSHLTEIEARKRFLETCCSSAAVVKTLAEELKFKGFINDIELNGVNGGTMDMAWMEISFETSDLYETLIDSLHDSFNHDSDDYKKRSTLWLPHCSLAYDNPDSRIPDELLATLIQNYPTLQNNRRFKAISLWSTQGTIEEWKCLERIPLKLQDDQ